MPHTTPKLTIIGDVGVDVILGPISGWPNIGTETITENHELRPGGSACNATLALNYLGSHCRLISTVGENHFGYWLREVISNTPTLFTTCQAETSLSMCLTHTCTERTIFTTKGHLELMSLEHIQQHLTPAHSKTDTVLLTGVFLTPTLRSKYLVLLQRLQGLGYKIALDIGWPSGGWNQTVREEVRSWLPFCDHLLINHIEALHIANSQKIEDAIKLIQKIMGNSASLIVKLGRDGALGRQQDSTYHISAPRVHVMDSTGAGDSFNAGYLHARLAGAPLKPAIEAGCQLASTIISRHPRSTIGFGEFSNGGQLLAV